MLDFRINTFLCVCAHMNFTQAAKELNMTQPGVSQHIRYLEKYYNEKLFNYNNKQLTLTPAGELLKNAMYTIRHDTSTLKHQMEAKNIQKKVINFGATLSIGEFMLPEMLCKYSKANNTTELNLNISNTHELLTQLDNGTIDFAFIEGNFHKSDYDYITIKSEEFVAVCGCNYDISSITDFSDLFSHRIIVREDGSGSKDILLQFLKNNGYSLSNFSSVFTVNSPHIMLNFLEHNMGISFLYYAVAKEDLKTGKLKVIKIPNFNVRHELNFIWRKNSIYSDFYRELYTKFFSQL